MNLLSSQPAQSEEKRKRNAFVISTVTGVIFTILAVLTGIVGYSESGLKGLLGLAITSLIAIASFIGAYQSRRGNPTFGIMILISCIFLLGFAIPFVVHGQGLALGIMMAILIAGISSTTLPNEWATRSIITGFVFAALLTLTDQYLPDFGLPTNPTVANIIASTTSVLYAAFILSRYNTYSLRTKIIIAFILITVTPLITLGAINNIASSQTLEKQSKKQLTTLASIAAEQIDGFINTQLDSVRTDAKQLSLITYLQSPKRVREGNIEEANAQLTLLALTRKDPVFINSVALIGLSGENLLDTFDENIDKNEGGFTYFSRPIQTGTPYVSNIFFEGEDAYIYFSAPVKTQGGKVIGILRVQYHATIIQSIINSIDPGAEDTIIALTDSNTYIRIGYTGNRDDLYKPYNEFAQAEFATLQAEKRLPTGTRANLLNDTDDEVVAGLDNLQLESFFNTRTAFPGSETINTGVYLKTQPWVAMVRQATDTYLTPVKDQQRVTILVSMILIIISIGLGFVTSQVLTSPLVSLEKVAEQIANGDIRARAAVTSNDEIGILSASFNRMTDQLNQTLNNLETRVVERTTDLEIAQKISEYRANELQAISEISKVISSEQKLENLLPLITRLVSERFGFYHVGIFFVEETGQFAVLQAANSIGGKKMLEYNHRLEVGESGLVGYVAQTCIARIALDVGQDAVYFNNPDLPTTRSEMALPLSVRNKTIGVLDIQSEKPGAFTENDKKTLGILADQISTAIENARLFTQTQQALNEAQVLYRQNLQEGWAAFIREEPLIGYRQNMKGGKKLTEPVETDEIREAVNRGSVLLFHADGVTEEASMVVPIKLRGQTIGSLNIKAPSKGRPWSSDEVNLTEVISERLSIALENARLIQESQRQVIKEQTISEVTGKIGASINLKNVLQTAVEELGRAMPGSEVIIKFKNEEN